LREAKQRFPGSFFILGVSNVSYGLAPAARKALNTVFLSRAVERGLDAAILHAGRLEPLAALAPEAVELCDDLIFNRPRAGESPLVRLLGYFAEHKEKPVVTASTTDEADERLRQAVIAGDQSGSGAALAELLKTSKAPAVIEGILIPAMAEVGRLFESGSLQLPFVLRSAETMRAALDLLKPSLGPEHVKSRGKLVIATVRGDIHDIGKNLVEMILSSNGFDVVNLGVRRTPEEVVEAVRQHKPDAVGLSGLLVESARSMKEYLQALAEAGFSLPVLSGGAALTREYVEKELQAGYPGRAFYARDAMDGLRIMQEICSQDKSEGMGKGSRGHGFKGVDQNPRAVRQGPLRPTPEPLNPSLRSLVKSARVTAVRYLSLLDRDAVLRKRWKMVTGRSSRPARAEAEAALDRLLKTTVRAGLWRGALCYAVYRCRVESPELVLAHPGTGVELARLNPSPAFARRLARQFGEREFPAALQLVTVGSHVVEETRKLAEAGKVHDQFLLHGSAAEMTEALAEYCQRQLPKLPGLRKTVRYSPGYPVWPELSEQRKVFALLGPERLGVALTDGFQMVPEYSTSAIVLPK
jgi:5-methyltetrahydrofolate--homocysteine methyltransferase